MTESNENQQPEKEAPVSKSTRKKEERLQKALERLNYASHVTTRSESRDMDRRRSYRRG